MGTEDNGLTLEGLAQRLEALEREDERMRSENAELRHKVATLEGSDTGRDGEPASEFTGRVSRGALLSKAGAAAVAAVAAGTLLYPREAQALDDGKFAVVYCDGLYAFRNSRTRIATVDAGMDSGNPAVRGENYSSGPGVEGITAGNGPAVEGTANGSNGTGVKGTGRYGVWGESNQGGFHGVFGRNTNAEGSGVRGTGDTGVWGSSSRTGFSGVYGQHTGSAGYGMVGDGKGSTGAGVLGRNPGGTGVRGEGSTGAEVAGVRGTGKTGVWGSSSAAGYSGVYGQHTGQGFGVVGDGRGNGNAGVLGRNLNGGYGGAFEGGQAQLRLVPKGTAGKPSGAHAKGEVYLDSAANLFVCTADGTPGTWRRFQTVAV